MPLANLMHSCHVTTHGVYGTTSTMFVMSHLDTDACGAQDMQVGDKINKITIVDGLENLKKPAGGDAPAPAAEDATAA